MAEHRLAEFESDFLQDGVFAVCSCGWKSLNFPNEARACASHRSHVLSKTANTTPFEDDPGSGDS